MRITVRANDAPFGITFRLRLIAVFLGFPLLPLPSPLAPRSTLPCHFYSANIEKRIAERGEARLIGLINAGDGSSVGKLSTEKDRMVAPVRDA